MSSSERNLPVNLYSAEQVRELDRLAIEAHAIPGYSLMQRAAKFSYQVLKEKWPTVNSIAVICGAGNNAGDGYVLAKLASEDGKQVVVVNMFGAEKLNGDAEKAYADLLTTNIRPIGFSNFDISEVDVVVDALFGTGLDRDVEGECHDLIEHINDTVCPVLSIDIPSGLNANTGSIMNIAIRADITATFIGLKQGMFTNDGPSVSGDIQFDDLAVPKEVYREMQQAKGRHTANRLELNMLNDVLEPRSRNSHKGHFGHVLVVGGDAGYLGAARMAAEAAGRVGAGLISVATRATHASLLSNVRPEIMSHAVESLDDLLPLMKRATVIAIGPGLGQSEWAKALFARVLESKLPLVIDADALNLLTEEARASKNWVLTPHPGEAARLLQTDSKTIQADRFSCATKLHHKYPGPVVLKGCGTVIADSEGRLSVCNAGNPGMSSGGMGDVLTGVIAGLIAQGIDINQAAKLGVCVHATAADRAASSGERGLLAMDLMPHLRNLVNLK